MFSVNGLHGAVFFHANNHLFHAHGLHEALFFVDGIAGRKTHGCHLYTLQIYFFLLKDTFSEKNPCKNIITAFGEKSNSVTFACLIKM